MSRTISNGPKDVRAIEAKLYTSNFFLPIEMTYLKKAVS